MPIRPVGPSVVNSPSNTTPTAPVITPKTNSWSGPPAVRDAFNTVAGGLKNLGPSSYELVPGRYPDAVPLTTVLNSMAGSPRGQAAVNKILDEVKARTGINIPPELRAEVMSNPAALTNILELTPGQLSSGIAALNAAHQAGKTKPAEAPKLLLPQNFDFANIDSVDAPRPPSTMKELAPGLYQGDLPGPASDAQVKRNRVVAEVFGRLSNNTGLADGDKFSVTHNGKAFTKLDDFVKALKADGYEVNVSFEQRVANFSNLKTVVPGSNPPKYLDVPAPLMIKTGIKDALGKEAIVPAVHSEMLVSIKGPKFNADIKYYQGTSGTGFFPRGIHGDPSWCGRSKQADLSGDDALKAISLAGAFTDIVNTTAKAKNLYADGYGVTGVCNDSVAVVQQAVTGRADAYPLLMKDSVLSDALNARLSDADKSVDATFRALRSAMRELPSDVRKNESQARRVLASLPWAAGREPFASSEDARRILSQ